MKTEVILCDLCKKKIATKKCVFCDKDMCEDSSCSTAIGVDLYRQSPYDFIVAIDSFPLCTRCNYNEKIKKIIADTNIYKEDQLEIAKKIVNSVKKRLIVENL